MVFPFPPAPGSFFVIANDGKGTALEVMPAGTVIVPGEGLPPEDDVNAATEEFEARFAKSDLVPRYVATHLNINTRKNIEQIRDIARREGWRVLVANRGGGLFQLIEFWVEDQFMLEVMTPEQTARYIEIANPEFMSKALNQPPGTAAPVENLNVIG